MDFVDVAALDALAPGGVLPVKVAGADLLLCRTAAGEVFAVENCCTHEYCPFGEPRMVDGELECRRHGARFDVRTGAATRLPAAAAIRTFPVRVEAGRVRVAV